MEREWKGNIRELKNFVYRMMVLSKNDELTWPETCPTENYQNATEEEAAIQDESSLKTLKEMERDYILFVLKKFNGNQSHAAQCLGLKRTTFISRLKKLGITD